MPQLVEFTNAGTYNKIMINPLRVMGVAAEDEDGKPFIMYEPHPQKKDRVYVTDPFDEIVAKINAGLK